MTLKVPQVKCIGLRNTNKAKASKSNIQTIRDRPISHNSCETQFLDTTSRGGWQEADYRPPQAQERKTMFHSRSWFTPVWSSLPELQASGINVWSTPRCTNSSLVTWRIPRPASGLFRETHGGGAEACKESFTPITGPIKLRGVNISRDVSRTFSWDLYWEMSFLADSHWNTFMRSSL